MSMKEELCLRVYEFIMHFSKNSKQYKIKNNYIYK